jgi:hypothetical protein
MTRNKRRTFAGILSFAFLLLSASVSRGDALLLTLSVASSTVQRDEEFVLTLEIYAPQMPKAPEVTIDGISNFQLLRRGTRLQEVPAGRTVKWVLTYVLIPPENGGFKLGPAQAELNGRSFYSNTLFITVQGAAKPRIKEQPSAPQPVTPAPQPPPPKPITAADLEDKIWIVLETKKSTGSQGEGFPVLLRLVSQVPVENLRYINEPDFPGFLKYDFPFTSRPKAERIQFHGGSFVSYDLQKFLIFPLEAGPHILPTVRCELRVRIPAGTYDLQDTVINLNRSSNEVHLQVNAVDPATIVGNFGLRNEVVSDSAQSKIVRIVLEGEGQLSTFDFPEVSGVNFNKTLINTSTAAAIEGENLKSRKMADWQITPVTNTTNIVLPEYRIRQLDPKGRRLSWLILPPLQLHFVPASIKKLEVQVPLPEVRDRLSPWIVGFTALSCVVLYASRFQRKPAHRKLRIRTLLDKKNPKLQISKTASRWLYQQISMRIEQKGGDGRGGTLIETLRQNLPEDQWLPVQRVFRKLEFNAFARSGSMPLTYGELRAICRQVEQEWLL